MEKTNLKTNRPVIFFDVETTGKDKDTNKIRIIELGAIKYKDTESWEEIDRLNLKFNNGDVPIEPGASEVHGLYHEDVKDYPTFHERAQEIYEWFKDCDLGGYNNSFFDNSVLFMSFLRAGIKWDYRDLKIYDILNLYRKNHNSKLTYVYKFYTGKKLDGAHDAFTDIQATVDVYRAMQQRGEDFEGKELLFYEDTLDMIGDFRMRETPSGEKEPYYNFGKHKGKSVEEVGIGYLEWMITKNADNFPLDTINVAKHLIKWLEKRYAAKSKEILNDKNWYNE